MANLIDYFNSGAIYENTGHVTYLTSKLSDIQEKIIPPFFFLDPNPNPKQIQKKKNWILYKVINFQIIKNLVQ